MGKLADIKTKQTDSSVADFIAGIEDEQKRKDCKTLISLMQKATGDKPKMWGPAIIGFGNKVYESSATGRQVDWFKMGLSPRKANLTLYLVSGLQQLEGDLKKLGKHKTGKGCLYISKLSDIDVKVLEHMIKLSAS